MNAADDLVGDLAKQIFKDHNATTQLHTPIQDGELDHELWRTLSENGFGSALAAGQDVTLRDVTGVLHSAGYFAARVPLADVMLAHWIAARAGWSDDTALPVVALDHRELALSVEGEAPTCIVSGSVAGVPWARQATMIYLVSGAAIIRVPASATTLRHVENLAGEPRDTVTFDRAVAERVQSPFELDEVLGRGALLRAALMVGAMERALDIAVDHAGTRAQFGRPIGKFQAIQQLLAQLAGHVAAAAAAVDLAAQHGTVLTAAIAKARTSEAAGLACEIAHQVVAAMGFTQEHPLHLVTRRLWAWRDECGSETFWSVRIGNAILGNRSAKLWPMLTSLETTEGGTGRAPVVSG